MLTGPKYFLGLKDTAHALLSLLRFHRQADRRARLRELALSRIGLDLAPVPHGAGPLNRIGQELGVRPPFRQTVRVCGGCNNGWMSHLETVARRVLTPFILGEAGQIETDDAGAVAAWVQKTALTAMLISSDAQRSAGYGLPPSEYRGLWTGRAAMQPLPASQFWIGRYVGRSRGASAWPCR